MNSSQFRLLGAVLFCFALIYPVSCCSAKQNAKQFYCETLALFDASAPGFGIDPGEKELPLDYPMTYALYASAEAHRASASKDRQALENAIVAARWLIEHNDLDNDGQIGWGLPRAWDAFGNGSINPPHTEYAITTALVIQALLDTWDAMEEYNYDEKQLRQQLLDNAIGAFLTFQDNYEVTPSGLVFFYSAHPNDGKRYVINSHSMLTGQFQRLSTYPMPGKYKPEIEMLTEAGFNYLNNHKRRDSSGVIYFNYSDPAPEGKTSRPNYSCHEPYTLQGILDYQLYSQTDVPIIEASDAARNIERFLEKSRVREFPLGTEYPPSYQSILDCPARLWGIGYLLYLSSRLELDNLSDSFFEILVTQYKQQGTLILRPDLEDTNFYPRHAAHALLGLSYYAW